MKRLVHAVIAILVFAGLSWTLWIGLRKQGKEGADETTADPAAPAAEEAKSDDFVVRLEKKKWEALNLEKGTPERADLRPQRIGFGRVLDPTPIVTLDGDLAAAEAALAASRAENERTQRLLAAGESASRKTAETAEAQFRSDEIKADGLRRRAALEWGALLPTTEPAKRREFIERLVRGEAALVRVDVLPGDALPESPKSARLVVLGRDEQPIETSTITAAVDVDVKTQAQGFILRVDHPPFPLRPGMALTAWLDLPGEARTGYAIPRSAILRHDGRAWIYVQADDEKFVRKPVILDSPLDGKKGWFVSGEGGGIKAEDQLVVAGGQSLLSEELKAQGGAAE